MKHIFFILILFASVISKGVNSAPKILRACVNFTDSIITVSWKSPQDVCESFTKYSLYGRKSSDPFKKIDDIPDINVIEYPHKIVDTRDVWQYYITIDHLCDGTTVLYSDTITRDITKPETLQLDSVSYDILSQKIIAGWQKNPSIDTKKYDIYDFSSGDGDSIASTTDTNHIVTDSKAGRFPLVISTIDSCNIPSLISRPHLPSFLNSSIDTCLRQITLNWSLYIGWSTIDSQSLYTSFDGLKFTKDTTLPGSISSTRFSKFILGDTIHFYVRSYSSNGSITSSSNIRTVSTRKFVVPQYLYLSLATVFDGINQKIATPSINWELDIIGDVSSFSIHEGSSDNNLQEVERINSTIGTLEYNFNSISKNAKVKSYFYKVIALDKCEDVINESNISRTIHLSINPLIVHNEYINWDVGVREYSLLKHDGSTWNTLVTQNSIIEQVDLTEETGCYRIKAVENVNQYNSTSISLSNIVCTRQPLQYFITSGINPNTENNRFVVLGNGIDHDKSYYQIFNRWGQQIVQNKTNVAWYANYKGEPVDSGTYVYIVTLYGELGERTTAKGIINVIR